MTSLCRNKGNNQGLCLTVVITSPIGLRGDFAARTILLMGAWGYRSLENDAGLNELELLFDKSQLADHVRESLQQELHECSDEIRATAYLVYVLAKHGLWEHESLREVVPLAISRLRSMLDEEVYTNVNFLGEIRHLINQLREVEPKPTQALDHPSREP